jgi:DNA (cytosine-5)-methyltransferase 1
MAFIQSHPELLWDIRILPEITNQRKTLELALENIPEDDSRWWSRERAEYFLNQLSSRHLKAARHFIAQDHFSYGTAFRRIRNGRSMAELRFDGVAGCLRTPRGGSGRQILFRAGKGEYGVRLLTPRECARLQGVPDDSYKIEVKDNQALFGFGDAVCVPVVQWIAENYFNPLVSELIRGRVLSPQSQSQ